MTTGLQDAANLGWKLASVIRGHTPDVLLDTYNDDEQLGGLVAGEHLPGRQPGLPGWVVRS